MIQSPVHPIVLRDPSRDDGVRDERSGRIANDLIHGLARRFADGSDVDAGMHRFREQQQFRS